MRHTKDHADTAESRLRLLSDASAALAESIDYEACLAKVGAIVVPGIADWCIVDVLEAGQVRPLIWAHAEPEKTALVRALYQDYPVDRESQQALATVWRSGASLLIPEVTQEFVRSRARSDEHLRLIEALEPRSLMAVPLVAHEKVIGSALFARSRSGNGYGADDLTLVEDLARRIAQTLENARLHRDLKEAMRQRIERDRFLSMTFGQLPGTVWTTDRDLRISYAAGRLAKESRVRIEAGVSIFDFLDTQDSTNPLIAHHRAALAGGRQSFDCKFADRWYAVRIEPLLDDSGQVTGCVGAAFDFTEQRLTQERLCRSEARLAEAQRVAHIGSFEWEIETDVVTWSDELNRIYGLQPGQFDGSYDAFLKFVQPDDLDATKAVIFDALRNGKPFVYEHNIIREDGKVRTLRTAGDVIGDGNGKPVRLVGSCWDVTQLKQAMSGLERTRSLLEATIESTADGLLVINRDGKVSAYNQRLLSLWRIPADLIKEGEDSQLLTFVADQLEDPDRFMKDVQELYDNPDRESFDVLHFKDGRVFERYSAPRRLGEEIVGRVWSFRDVTERERLFRRALFLADATRLLASLDIEPALDSVAHMAVPYIGDVCAIDLLGNGGPRRLLVVSRDPAQSIAPELHSAALTGHPTVYDVGTRSYMAVPFVVKGDVIGAATFVAASGRRYSSHDLELAEELGRRAALSVENARLYRAAQEALKARDEFLTIAAHEIRGPITSMHMAVQGLKKDRISPGHVPKVLEIIEREDRRLARFVDELLDLDSIRTGRIRFNIEEVDLGDVVREVASSIGAELARVGSSLSITSKGRPIGQWDRFRLDQVVRHLLSNALKFGLGKPIEVSVEEREGITTLVVKDHGTGIRPEMLKRIFRPFDRAVPVRHYGGLGLGLFIARTTVESLGGSVSVESKLNVGSTFTVVLPPAK